MINKFMFKPYTHIAYLEYLLEYNDTHYHEGSLTVCSSDNIIPSERNLKHINIVKYLLNNQDDWVDTVPNRSPNWRVFYRKYGDLIHNLIDIGYISEKSSMSDTASRICSLMNHLIEFGYVTKL